VKLERRSLHTGWKPGELHLSIGVGSSFEIEPPHSTKPIFDMNLDGGCIDRLAVRVPYRKFKGTGTSTAVYDWNFFAGCGYLGPRKRRGCDENRAQNTKHPVHMFSIIRATKSVTCREPVVNAPRVVGLQIHVRVVYSTPSVSESMVSISAPKSLPSEPAFLYGLEESR
jgi:hypothetical protein